MKAEGKMSQLPLLSAVGIQISKQNSCHSAFAQFKDVKWHTLVSFLCSVNTAASRWPLPSAVR